MNIVKNVFTVCIKSCKGMEGKYTKMKKVKKKILSNLEQLLPLVVSPMTTFNRRLIDARDECLFKMHYKHMSLGQSFLVHLSTFF